MSVIKLEIGVKMLLLFGIILIMWLSQLVSLRLNFSSWPSSAKIDILKIETMNTFKYKIIVI